MELGQGCGPGSCGCHGKLGIPSGSAPQIQHCHAECVTDTQVCGARFCDPAGDTFAVTGYDLSEILCYGPA